MLLVFPWLALLPRVVADGVPTDGTEAGLPLRVRVCRMRSALLRRLMVVPEASVVTWGVTGCFSRLSTRAETYGASLETPFASHVLWFFPACVRPQNPPYALPERLTFPGVPWQADTSAMHDDDGDARLTCRHLGITSARHCGQERLAGSRMPGQGAHASSFLGLRLWSCGLSLGRTVGKTCENP